VDEFVKKQPFAEHGREAPPLEKGVMRRARAGGQAAAAAANRTEKQDEKGRW